VFFFIDTEVGGCPSGEKGVDFLVGMPICSVFFLRSWLSVVF